MITTFELKSIVYQIVKSSNIKTAINGEVYNGVRPLNSSKNDVVIGALSIPNEVLSPSTVLINIYAKDIQLDNTYYPDMNTLSKATKLLMPLFREVFLEEKNTYLDIEYQRDYKVEDSQEWVSVIRLTTRTINIKNNKNE